jgi:hypothetical protein
VKLDRIDYRAVRTRHGSFDVIASKVIGDWSLESENMFECSLALPVANLSRTEEILYCPSGVHMDKHTVIIISHTVL